MYLAGDVLSLERRPVDVDPLAQYQEIGIRSFGRGIFHKEPVLGADLGNKRVFWIRPGDLIFSNVFAWEGAVALAGPEEAGKIGSHRFMTYIVQPDIGDVRYLLYFFSSERGLALLRQASPGSAGRNRTLAIDRFASLKIPLPDLEEQRRSARRLEQFLSRVQPLDGLVRRADWLTRIVADAAIQRILDQGVAKGWDLRPLGEVAQVNPPPTPLASEQAVSFVPMAAVDDQTGTIARAEERMASEVQRGYKQFRRGDVIFARITPSMQNGKSAVVQGLISDYGYGSTEFHVLRPSSDVIPEWIHRILRTSRFRTMAAERFTGTAGQQRVPAGFLEAVEVPVPKELSNQQDGVARIDRILELAARAKQGRKIQLAELQALVPSVLNAAFNGSR
jgi:type I restriction enzyme S subunit